VSVELTGVLLGVFAAIMSAVIYAGGFAEQKRANEDYAKTAPRR
jgi:hypothetical protein